MRVGTWEYYDLPGILSLKVDYDQGTLLYVHPDTSDFYVKEGEGWTRTKLAVPCRFNGSISSLIDHYDQFTVPYELVKQKKQFSTWLSFQVGPDGMATDPQVINDPGQGVKEQILELFKLSPNSWIPGVNEASNPVTCRMAIRFDYCESCDAKADLPAYVLFTGTHPHRGGPLGSPTPVLSFSPDSRKLIFMPNLIGLPNTDQRARVIDLKTKSIQELPYPSASTFWWIDNDQLFFLPRYYSRVPYVLARVELSTGKVTFLSDSTISGVMFSPDAKKAVYLSRPRHTRRALMLTDLVSGQTKTIMESVLYSWPERWSPDGSQVVVRQQENGVSKFTLVNIATATTKPLPLFNANICGWSPDGKLLYQYKNSRDEYTTYGERETATAYDGIVSVQTIKTTKYEPITELFETPLETNVPRSILKKSRDMRVSYSAARNKFLLIMDKSAYLLDTDPEAKPVKIIEKCQLAEWSGDGAYIAFISSRDQQLNLYHLDTGQSEILTAKTPGTRK